eukprot:6176040-Pleurochrysis_carterae.AAC.4
MHDEVSGCDDTLAASAAASKGFEQSLCVDSAGATFIGVKISVGPSCSWSPVGWFMCRHELDAEGSISACCTQFLRMLGQSRRDRFDNA